MLPILCSLCVMLGLLANAPTQSAAKRLYVVAVVPAPVLVVPDAGRTPLRTLSPGTRMKVLLDRGDWYRVEFSDPLWGPRVGYVQKKHVEVAEPDVDVDTPAIQPPSGPPRPATPPKKPKQGRG